MRAMLAVLVLALAGCSFGPSAAEWNDKGLAAIKLYDQRGALEAFAQAVKADPSSARYHTNLAISLTHFGLFQRAIDEYRAALAIDPAYPGAAHGMEVVSRHVQSLQAQQQADLIADELRN